jgi:hypothetical protein
VLRTGFDPSRERPAHAARRADLLMPPLYRPDALAMPVLIALLEYGIVSY